MNKQIELNLIISIIALSWTIVGLLIIKKNQIEAQPKKRYPISLLIVYSLSFVLEIVKYFSRNPASTEIVHTITISFLYGPLLYFFYKEILNQPIKSKKIITLHILPFFIALLFDFLLHFRYVTEDNLFFIILSPLSILIYGIIILQKIINYNKFIDTQFSSHETEITLSWLKALAIGYIILFGLSFSTLFLLRPNFIPIPKEITAILSAQLITNIPLVFFILTFVINYPNQQIIKFDEQVPKEIDKTIKDKHKCSDKALLEQVNVLKNHMKEKKLYLDCDLTLDKLSQEINISRHKISYVITEGMNSNFYTFINEYRIKEFINLVKEGKNKDMSILGLAFECGFKGSSSFYNAMKKEKQMTPKQLISKIENGIDC
ncbi:MAG: AraC family transcriptional regulator [Sphaerochaetaceae bacterium]|nr:AraC family transcriptional regulator [Sphaerochaetaceae bacterium]